MNQNKIFPCLTSNHKVLTPGNGFVEVGLLKSGDTIINIDPESPEEIKISEVRSCIMFKYSIK